MENKERIKPLTSIERKFATEKHNLITDFLKYKRLNEEEFYDVVVFDFLLSVEIYLNSEELQKKYNFEAISYMFMKRALYRYFRAQKALKRSHEDGVDISFDVVDTYIEASINSMENSSLLEYEENIKQIESILTLEQQLIFFYKLEGYSLKEIAENNGIKIKRVYKQFGKIKKIVADVMGINQKIG